MGSPLFEFLEKNKGTAERYNETKEQRHYIQGGLLIKGEYGQNRKQYQKIV